MKFIKYSAIFLLAGFLTAGLSTQATAQSDDYDQSYRDATSAFNKALDSANSGDYEAAINMFNQAISLAEQSEYSGASDLVSRAENQLPQIHFQFAAQQFRAFQQNQSMASLETAVNSFQEAADISEEFGNGEIAQKADDVVNKLLYQKALIYYKSQDFQAADSTLDVIIERYPNYAQAYYQKALVFKKQNPNNLEPAFDMFDKALEVAESTNNNAIARQARESIRDNLIYRGVTAGNENKNYTLAIELLNRALEYDSESSSAYYRLAEAYNKRGDRQQALSHGQTALEYATGGKTELAKIYYEIGLAHQALGNSAEACSAFSNAAFGNFKSNAEYKLEHELECESSTR